MTKKPIVCSKCKKKYSPDEYPKRWYTNKHGEKYKVPHGPCYPCKRKENKIQKQKAIERGDYYPKQREYKRRYREKNLEKIREKNREYAVARRRREGAKPNKRSLQNVKGNGKDVPLKPFAELLRQQVNEHSISYVSLVCKVNTEDIKALMKEVYPRRSPNKGKPRAMISEQQVDKILIGLNLQEKWHELYPLED